MLTLNHSKKNRFHHLLHLIFHLAVHSIKLLFRPCVPHIKCERIAPSVQHFCILLPDAWQHSQARCQIRVAWESPATFNTAQDQFTLFNRSSKLEPLMQFWTFNCFPSLHQMKNFVHYAPFPDSDFIKNQHNDKKYLKMTSQIAYGYRPLPTSRMLPNALFQSPNV